MSKILIEAPILTQSGYGEHARLVFKALSSLEGLELYVNPLNWGSTPWTSGTESAKIDESITRFVKYVQTSSEQNKNPEFDVHIHVGIPSEYQKKAPFSVCVTAGIETDRVSHEWLIATHQGMDRLVVPSNHAKSGFTETHYEMINETQNTKTEISCNVPVEVVPYPIKEVVPQDLEFSTDTEFNFLCISLLGARKNMENMVKWFVEEFRNENVGLILKTSRTNGSRMDRNFTLNHFKKLLNSYSDRKCKVYLLHGDLTEEQIHSLYLRKDVHAFMSATHGEGYGLPIFESAYYGLPVVATDWSAHLDFLTAPFKEGGKQKDKKLFAKVDYDLKEIPPEAVWDKILIEGSRWAFPKENSFRKQIRNVYKNYGMYKKWAGSLKNHIQKTHKEKNVLEKMKNSLLPESVLSNLETLNCDVSKLPKISIITSVYDGDKYIEGFLKDIESQTIFKDKCELILINAASPGNEEAEILKFKEKYPENVIYKKLDKDPGIYACWNKAIEISTGEYITNANLDDRKKPTFLEDLARQLHVNENIGVVYADNLVTNSPNETWENNTASQLYPSEEFDLEAMLRGNPPHCMPMWRKELHKENGFFKEDYRSASDWEFWLRCAFAGVEMKKINKKLGLYYFNPKGMSTNKEHDTWKRQEEKEIFVKYFALMKEKRQTEKEVELVL